MKDHGGNLDWAIRQFGGADWIDLSTGINRVPYPVGDISAEAWASLPTRARMADLTAAAAAAYGSAQAILPLSGAQGAIQLVPRLQAPGLARVLGPTYNEHAHALRNAGWQVQEVGTLDALAGADLAVVVNPNNPDGKAYDPGALLALAGQVGRLVVDESFGDAVPHLSVAAQAGQGGLVVLRSFGKFFGLAGLRLGFALCDAETAARLADMAGPWPVAGPAIDIGIRALGDRDWAKATIARLTGEAAEMDAMATRAGWSLVGGTHLFRTYAAPDASAAQTHLSRAQIWSRIFPYSAQWIRLGLPGNLPEWNRLAAALGAI